MHTRESETKVVVKDNQDSLILLLNLEYRLLSTWVFTVRLHESAALT